jgi:hypothetical protein
MVGGRPNQNDGIQWVWDYYVGSWDAVNFIETWTYYINGAYATGTYTGGTITGYLHVKYDDINKSNLVSTYSKKA